MTFPIDLVLGPVVVPLHPILESLAFVLGYAYYKRVAKQSSSVPLSPETEWKVIVGMAVGALVGSRLIGALEYPQLFMSPPSWLFYFSSKTVAGGLFGGIIGVEVAKKIVGIKRKTGDLFVYPLMLAIVIGRLGCFLTGVTDGTVGNPANVPWAFDQGDGIARHPTSAYEIVLVIFSFFALKALERRKELLRLREGDLFAIFMLVYFLYRFFVEYIKPTEVLVLGLSSIQFISFVAVIYYMCFFIRRLWLPKGQ